MLKKKFYTIGQIEAEISDAIIRFEKEYIGRGPLETKTYILNDMIITRLRGVLTKAEKKLLKSDSKAKGRDLIKQVRIELIESGRPLLEAVIKNITKRKVRSIHTDISTTTGEKIIIFILDKPFEIS
ncbi:MAG: DUF2294 domain-containing protein [Chitinispirillia bacterium]|jgi:uncharacterized protein YbcI